MKLSILSWAQTNKPSFCTNTSSRFTTREWRALFWRATVKFQELVKGCLEGTNPSTNSASLLEWSMDCVVSRIPRESVLHCGAQPGIIPRSVYTSTFGGYTRTLTLIVDLSRVHPELTHLSTIGSYTLQLWKIPTSVSVGLFTTRLAYMSTLGDYRLQLHRAILAHISTPVGTYGHPGSLQSLDWTGGLDWWTGLVDWTGAEEVGTYHVTFIADI